MMSKDQQQVYSSTQQQQQQQQQQQSQQAVSPSSAPAAAFRSQRIMQQLTTAEPLLPQPPQPSQGLNGSQEEKQQHDHRPQHYRSGKASLLLDGGSKLYGRETEADLLLQAYQSCLEAEIMAAKGNCSKIRRAGKSALKNLKKSARYCPENVMNKIFLMEASHLAARGQRTRAIDKYHESIRHAKRQGFIQEEALACEQAGLALMEWGEEPLGMPLLERARVLYETWGSPAKVQQVQTHLDKGLRSPLP